MKIAVYFLFQIHWCPWSCTLIIHNIVKTHIRNITINSCQFKNLSQKKYSVVWIAKTGLTFSLNLEHTDGVLWREVPELAGGERVSSLSQRADHSDRRLQEEGLEERWATDLLCHDAWISQDWRFWLFLRALLLTCLLLLQYFTKYILYWCYKWSQSLPTKVPLFSVCPTVLTVV